MILGYTGSMGRFGAGGWCHWCQDFKVALPTLWLVAFAKHSIQLTSSIPMGTVHASTSNLYISPGRPAAIIPYVLSLLSLDDSIRKINSKSYK